MALTPFFDRSSLWDSFGRGRDLFQPFEQLAQSLWEDTPFRSYAQDAHAVASTRVDWVETPDSHVFKADLPGLKKEDINVSIEDDRTLQISGERKKEDVKRAETWHSVERSHGKFLRRFRLPENAKVDLTNVKVENGLLTVTIPKLQQKVPQIRTIEIS